MWTKEQQAALEREYARIGSRERRWPYPSPAPTPEELLALLRRVPDGAGLTGYIAALEERARTRS